MEKEKRPGGQPSKPSRRTLRLTFKVTDGNFELLSHESLDMITPPQVGERPEAGKHSGLWIELQDTEKRVLAHRVLNAEQLNSVEVHSPDGKIERIFGKAHDGVLVVLLPDFDESRSAVLIGDPLVKPPSRGKEKAHAVSGELARFDLPQRRQGGE